MSIGLRHTKGFISNIFLITFVVIMTYGTLFYTIINLNLKSIYYINNIEEQGFLESLIINRIKYAVETLDYNEEPLYYDDVTINIVYDFEDVTVEYIYPDRTLTKYYHYDLKSKTIEVILDNVK